MSEQLTAAGFSKKNLATVRAELEADFREAFGQSIRLTPDTVFGVLIGIFAEREALLWDLAEATYAAAYPSPASGVSLDRVVDITGIARNPATRSTGTVFCRGSLATIPAGTRVAVSGAGDHFRTTAELGLPAAHELTGLVANGSVQRSGSTVMIDFEAHGFSVGDWIWVEGLDQDAYNGVWPVATVPDADHLTYEISGTPTTPATSAEGANAYRAYPVGVESVETGPVQALAGTLTVIVQGITGWDAVTNREDVALGRHLETDAELRARRIATLTNLGNATVEALVASLLAVQGVTSATVYTNDGDTPDIEGRPPHSFEALVQGGADGDIRAALFANKAAGIETHGDISGTVTDSQGFDHNIRFSRPVDIDIWLELDLTVNAEYPPTGDTQVTDALLAFGNGLVIGQDVVVYPSLVGALSGIPGITDVQVAIGTAASPSGDDNIPIGQTEIAAFDSSRITITQV